MFETLLLIALTKSAPLILAALGGLLSERAGIVNVGLEGTMLAGAYAAAVGSLTAGNPWVGLMVGGAVGGLLGLLHALACIRLRSDHVVSGTAINLLALGGTGFLLFRTFGVHGNTPTVPKLTPWSLPGLNPDLFRAVPTVYLALAAVAVAHLVLYRTVWGLRLRAVGERPEAALAAGVPIRRVQYGAVALGGLLAGWGGAHLSLGDLSQFVERMTSGRGFVALAALICGRWHPVGVLAACLFFGFVEAFAEGLQGEYALPSQFFLALPFLLTIGVLAGFAGKARPPAALGRRVGEEGI
ncbi:MAG: ABC transporter permease [Candidatus Latescibacteria bacterium]|nr:ABC transporter permease [Candidatus Latescibacterota bacterium]